MKPSTLKKITILFPILLLLLFSFSCREKRMLKLANGTFEKPYPSPCVYTDSTTQILYEAINVKIDSKNETMSWRGGTTKGEVDIKLAKSDRGNDNELRLGITDYNAYKDMLPTGAWPNQSLNNARIYITPSKRAMTMNIVIDGQETTYYFVNYR